MKLAVVIAAGLALSAPALADTLYVLAGNVNPTLMKLDPATGGVLESHAVTGQEALFGGLAGGPSGPLFSIDGYNDGNSDRLFSIDPATGTGTVIGPTRFNWNFRTVCVNPVTGALYGATDNVLYTLDTSTGMATVVAQISGANLDQLTALAIGPAGQAYITDIGNTDLFSLNLQTGQATFIASIGDTGNWFNDLAFDSAGILHGVRNNGGFFSINTATGVITSQFGGLYTGLVYIGAGAPSCYANCDGSTAPPILNANDFQCFLNEFAAGDSEANCDGSTAPPVLNANDFQCFLNTFAAGCT